ncbi:MAG: hypothetical protein AAB576_08355 [Elusimicrobiota bacterium]
MAPGPVFRFLAQDHERLDALLTKAFLDPERVDHPAYHGFRTGLLRHIGMEEALGMLKAAPEVPVRPYNTRPEVQAATRRALRWAGYGLEFCAS